MSPNQLVLRSLLSLVVFSIAACDVKDESLVAEVETDDLEFRGLSGPYDNEEVLIQSAEEGTCLAFDPNAGSSPLQLPCDPKDHTQLFTLGAQTYEEGAGFIYKVCSVADPSVCLMHESSGTTAFLDEAKVQDLGGEWFDKVRIQQGEHESFIEFRYSGLCLTFGDPPIAQSCDGSGSTEQQYRILGDCDIWNQDCTPQTKCVPYAWGMDRCVPMVPADQSMGLPRQSGDPCTVASGRDNCDRGSLCLYVSPDTNEGICTSFCTGSSNAPDCNDPASSCVSYAGAPVCLAFCDPITQNCGSEQVCAFASGSDTFVCFPDTVPNGIGVYGASCSSDDACNPGLACGAQSDVPGCTNPGGCCSDFCDLAGPNPDGDCSGVSGGQMCEPWFGSNNIPPGYENIGFCAVP